MGTTYGYHCADCDKSSDHWIKDNLVLVKMIQADRLLYDHGLHYDIEYYPEFWSCYGSDMRIFLDEHRDHKIMIESEYGEKILIKDILFFYEEEKINESKQRK